MGLHQHYRANSNLMLRDGVRVTQTQTWNTNTEFELSVTQEGLVFTLARFPDPNDFYASSVSKAE